MSVSRSKKIRRYLKKRLPKTHFILALALFIMGKSALHQLGWFKSAWRMSSIDNDGHPVPWLTYSAIFFIKPRVNNKMRVFEYGSGNSTIWWSKRVKEVVSIEHDKHWFEVVKNQARPNTTIMLQEINSDYPKKIIDTKGLYDIVIIDGRKRVESAKNAIKKLKVDGVIIWDNTDRERYRAGINFLLRNGFKRIDFYGLVPVDNAVALTSIFYRKNNVLNI